VADLSTHPFTILRNLGWSVFPARRDANNPARNKEPLVAWKRYQQKRASYTLCEQWDTAANNNLAVVTGRISGLWVLDIDGDTGKETLARLTDQHGPLPETICVRTGSGGLHYYFRFPDSEQVDIRNMVKKDRQANALPGIDVRGDGGYVIAPPSIHESGNAYEWLVPPSQGNLKDAPDWLLNIADRARTDDAAPLLEHKADSDPTPDALEKFKQRQLNRLRKATNGSRNDMLNKVTFLLAQKIPFGLDRERTLRDITDIARQIGLDDAEITRTMESAISAGLAQPSNALKPRSPAAPKLPKSSCQIEVDAIDQVQSLHLGLALEAIETVGSGDLIYTRNRFYHWPKGMGYWQVLDDRELRRVVHRIGSNIPKLSKNMVDSVCDMVRTEVTVKHSIFNQHNELMVNCRNGELHFENGAFRLRPHKREHYLTYQIPVAYDPNATAERFMQFLLEIFEGDADRSAKAQVLLEMIGYTLLSTCAFEKFIILIGNGANGNSVLLKVLTTLIGPAFVSAVTPSQFDNRFQRAHLDGKQANIVTELAEGGEIAEATLKAIVSGEVITAEHKHKPPFEFRPTCTCWFGTNHMPQTRDFSDAMTRRAIILTFNRKFEGDNCDPHLADKLIAELPGILNLALQAISGVLDQKAFTEPASSLEAKANWKLESDQVAQFIDECCLLHKDYETPSNEVYTRYKSWAQEAGSFRPLNRKNFTNRLKRFGVEPFKGTGGKRMLFGIRLLPNYDGGLA
jgi:putative DNA primase/helicase